MGGVGGVEGGGDSTRGLGGVEGVVVGERESEIISWFSESVTLISATFL